MSHRIHSYDVFRGVLIIATVVAHVVTNFLLRGQPITYFSWVSVGFILFLGIVTGQFLEGKNRKIIFLALKLIALYLVGNYRLFLNWKPENIWAILTGDQQVVSFEILLVMGAVLLVSPLVLKGLSLVKKPWIGWLMVALLCMVIGYLEIADIYLYNLLYFVIGLIGVYLGKQYNLDALILKLPKKQLLLPLLGAFVGVIFILQIVFLKNFPLLTLLQVLSLYTITVSLIRQQNILEWLGRYSLAIYIGHIIFFKLLAMMLF